MCFISRLFDIRAFSGLKLFDPVEFYFVSLNSPVVKLNESVDVFLLSVFSNKDNVPFEFVIGRNVRPCVVTQRFWTSSFFGVTGFSAWRLTLRTF